MARAIRAVTVERGHDPRGFGLVAFGGAGPMHAAAVAESLDMDSLVDSARLRRALGLRPARRRRETRFGSDPQESARGRVARRRRIGLRRPHGGGAVGRGRTRTRRTSAGAPTCGSSDRASNSRFRWTTSSTPERVAERFRDAHESAYGYVMDDPIELVNVRVTSVVARDSPSVRYRTAGDAEKGRREAFFDDGFHETPVFDREPASGNRTPSTGRVSSNRTRVRSSFRRDGRGRSTRTGRCSSGGTDNERRRDRTRPSTP